MGKRLLLAVSGGLDSVCLLHYFATNAARLGIEIAVAHVEHGIRGAASAEDAEFVRAQALKYDVPFYVTHLGSVLKNVANVEERARELRYEFLHKIKAEHGFDFIATAHHGDDQAETLYMRLVRGTSLVGLRGVKKFREDGVYRPFLGVFRSDLQQYAAQNGLQWREDATNADTVYRRNFVRNVMLPRLEQNAPGYKAALCRVASHANTVYDRVIREAEQLFTPMLLEAKNYPYPIEILQGTKVIALKFDTLNETLQRLGAGGEELFRIWLTSLGFDVPPGNSRSPIFPLPDSRRSLRALYLEKSLNLLWIVGLPFCKKFDILYFCKAKKLPEGAIWRYRKDGDFFCPPGMHCKRRKLSKWLQENGIPLFVRDSLPVLANGQNVLKVASALDFELNK